MGGGQGKALIVGGGIGGLCAALALRQAGYAVEVYEAAPEIREVGAGLTLWPNALRALDLLGVGDSVRSLGVPDVGGGIYTWRGAPLATESSAAFVARFGALPVVVHRAEFQTLLADALGRDAIHLGTRLVDVTQGDGAVEARFPDGRTARGDVLVGADGIRSVVRSAHFPSVAPRYAGYPAWRMIIPFEHARVPTWGESWGQGERVGVVPVSRERVYLFATANLPAGGGQSDTPDGRKLELLRCFGKWHAPIPDLIVEADPAAILRNDIEEVPPLPRWSVGRITLLGDAAHAMTPNLGQGACLAVEDAVVLGACLAETQHGGTVEAALARYERLRQPRTARIHTLSRRIGEVGQWANPLACALRDLAVHLVPERARLQGLDSILAYDVGAAIR